MDFEKHLTATLDDIVSDPHKYGAPTFAEFAKNPDKWRSSNSNMLDSVDAGSILLRQILNKQIYEIDGYRCNSLEEVERVAKDQGIDLNNIVCRPEVVPVGGGRCDILVKFTSRKSVDERKHSG